MSLKYIYHKIILLLLFIFLSTSGCSDRSSSVTGPSNSARSGSMTVTIYASQSKVAVGETFTISVGTECNGCYLTVADWPVSYTANGMVSPSSGTGSVTVEEDTPRSSIAATFTLEATSTGRVTITGTGGSSSDIISVSTEVVVEGYSN